MRTTIKNIFPLSVRSVYYNSKFVILLWALSAVSALTLSMPVYHMMYESLSNSFLNDQLAAGFDHLWLMQFFNIYSSQIAAIHYLFIAAMLIYLLIQIFFSAGLITVFNHPKKNHFIDFFYGGVKYWVRFLGVLVISISLYVLAFLLNNYLGKLIHYVYAGSENALLEFIFKAAKYLLLIFLIGITAIITDYSRIVIVCKEERNIFNAIIKAFKLIKSNFNLIFSVFLVISIIGALGAIVYNAIGFFIPRTPYYFLILTFILQQMLIIFRLFIRMLFFSSGVLLFKDLNAEVIE